MRLTLRFGLLAVLALAAPAAAQSADSHLEAGHAAMGAEQWADAESHFEAAYLSAGAEAQDSIAFFQAFSVYKQGEAVARANAAGSAEQARIALAHFERALPVLQRTTRPQRSAIEQGIRMYIQNQRMIIDLLESRSPG
jgi:RecA/RadA recombinase